MKKTTTKTGRRARAPKLQNILNHTEEGRALREDLASRTPKLDIDYSEIERRIMERINKTTDDTSLEACKLIAVLGYDVDSFETDLKRAQLEVLDALEARLATEDQDEDERTKMLSRGGIRMVQLERGRRSTELREWITSVCVLVGNANRRGGADESLLAALNILRARALERGYVVPGINWSTYVSQASMPEEREACARVCDGYADHQNNLIMTEVEAGREQERFAATCLAKRGSARELARRIRARSA